MYRYKNNQNKRRYRKILRDNVQGITKPAIQRLARVAGVKATSGLVYEEIRGVIKQYLERVLRIAVATTEYRRARTMTVDDLEFALRMMDKTQAVLPKHNIKPCKVVTTKRKVPKKIKLKPGTKALADIRRYQKYSGCFHIAKIPFSRLVREVAQDLKDDLRFQEQTFVALQAVTEDHVVQLFYAANMIAINEGQTTVANKHIQTARHTAKVLKHTGLEN